MATIQSILNKIASMANRTGLFSIQKSEFFDTLTDITNKVKEVNDNVNSVSKSLIWQSPVANFAALATTYPTPAVGWAAMVTSLGFIYSWNGSAWKDTGLNSFPGDVLTKGTDEIYTEILSKNLFNKDAVVMGFYLNQTNGALVASANYYTSDYIPTSQLTSYVANSFAFIVFYDASKIYLSGITAAGQTAISTPANAAYFRISQSVNITALNIMQVEIGSIATSYAAFGFKEKYQQKETNTLTAITAKRYGTAGVDADFIGQFAIQNAIDSITDASETKQYEVVFTGIFEALQTTDFKKGDQVGAGQKHFIEGKSFVHLRGVGKDESVIKINLPSNLGAGFAYSLYNGILWNANANLTDFSISGENCRYSIHIDGGQLGCKDFNQTIKGCRPFAKNTGDALNWSSNRALGVGMSDGHTLNIEDCEIESKQPLYFHTNKNFSKPSRVNYKRTHLILPESLETEVIVIQSLGSRKRDLLTVDNCIVDGGILSISDSPWIPESLADQLADHAEIDANLASQLPMAVTTSFGSRALKIASKSVGAGSTVYFDKNSSAFDLIIGNSLQATEIKNKYNRKQIYGYQYKIGGVAVGYAIGSLDIAQHLVGVSLNKYIGALGKRLGDCSVTNKTLTVIIDGTTYNIVFNKNYNGTAETVAPTYSNTQIIAEITAVIGAVATVTEFDISSEYYPNFKSLKSMINADTTEVYAGMGVVFTSLKQFRKALSTDLRVDGIVLDYGEIGDKCRVIAGGEIYAQISAKRFSIKEINTFSYNVGDGAGISSTTPGTFDRSAATKLLICTSANILKIK